MLHTIIQSKKNEWIQSPDCAVSSLLNYIREKGQLRDTQIEAIETYLFLKIQGENKPLWQLFSEGFFKHGTDLNKLNINQAAREYLEKHVNAQALYDFARQPNGKGQLIPNLSQAIVDHPETLDYDRIIRAIFYNVSYADYLMSLPMGAGKTFLMAAIIYLDLYFADNDPDNKAFAHNFLVLVPSGLKSSIIPSLRTIQNFDPSWVLPEPSASKLKRLLKFDVLDEAKTAKKSNKARNPNAQKVNACLPNPFGQVFVVNAEKVVLESFKFDAQLQLALDEEEKDTTNDLKRLFGQIPNMSILIDEVHHAASDDIKLRQAVNYWQSKGNITTVLGFSGTPYLSSAETIPVGDFAFKFAQITNTVYFYPLVTAIRKFLKSPTVRVAESLDRLQIIEQGIRDFDGQYKTKRYGNGTIAKIAIYCSNIEVLEEEIYPFLTGTMQIDPSEILKYHGGNATYKLPKENELEFRSLDLPISRKQYILLVQVGKEGWDCPSLTGVVLSQKGDCPQNMVLQTSCRCLRQVDKNSQETALIWLNKENAQTLNDQLKKEQETSIQELNGLKKVPITDLVMRVSRMDYLNLPTVDFYQLKVTYQAIEEAADPQTAAKLKKLRTNLDSYKSNASVSSSELMHIGEGDIAILGESGNETANFNQWKFAICRESLSTLGLDALLPYESTLKAIFQSITFDQEGKKVFDDRYDRAAIASKIRLAFVTSRELETKKEVVPQAASLLIVENLDAVERNPNLFPNDADVAKILSLDPHGVAVERSEAEILQAYDMMKQAILDSNPAMAAWVPTLDAFRAQNQLTPVIANKDSSFHYLPYNFKASTFEMLMLQRALALEEFKQRGLEIYYNGERGLTGFVIHCFAKEGRYWKNIGKYTADFLIIQRKAKDKIHKALILETKGAGYANDPVFIRKKKFLETTFIEENKANFGYKRFDFLYLEDSNDLSTNVLQLNSRITQFFND
ncbi:MAG: DEAD/DEAH box helicase family protein [Bacteroidetes bacterium]|nr:DEAD/DEAH box helicase family protein [Bacteroidota bacterium]MBP6639211.1 DEAD/DEAH box helicase family protein [Bacteroidia bacterium]MBP6720847.1 DEAD/DEAH box helicase family protein [Bacteroidia bacterium]MBP8073222.1 DEAD/DEAH box helicase family protein [Bacteroidia bacterium]